MKRSRGLYLISPPMLVVFAWGFTMLGTEFAYALRESLPVLVRTMNMNGIGFDVSVTGVVWVGVSLLTFVIIGLAATKTIPRTVSGVRPAELSSAVRVAALAHAFIVVVVIIWVLVGAKSVGGFDRLVALAAEQDTYVAKTALLDSKLFPGMRLFYTGLDGLGVFGASVFVINLQSENRNRGDMRAGLLMFLVSAVVLSLLPIILSQRILLIHMVLSTFIAVSVVSGRLFQLRYGLALIALLLAVWSLRESVTVGEWASEYSALRIGLEKLLYYIVNDFYNAVVPFSTEIPHTLGFLSFGFILAYTPMGGAVYSLLAERADVINDLRAGGAYPALTAPYVDFSWFGIILIAALALVFAWVFNKAQRSFTYAMIYGQIGGALLLSPHSAWYSNPNFSFNVLLTCFVCAFIKKRYPLQAGKSYEAA